MLHGGAQGVAETVRCIEGGCGAHAASEGSQQVEFSATLELGEGVQRTYALPIPKADQVPMRHRVDDACEILGLTGPLDG